MQELQRRRQSRNVTINGADLIPSMRNFKGEPGPFNSRGDREFVVSLEGQHGALRELEDAGYDLKQLKPREEGDEPTPILRVRAYYPVRDRHGRVVGKGQPPRVVVITSRGRTDIDDELIEQLDWADFANVDLIVRPFDWDFNGGKGTKAYLKALYVTLAEDELEQRYRDVPVIGAQPDRLGITAGPSSTPSDGQDDDVIDLDPEDFSEEAS